MNLDEERSKAYNEGYERARFEFEMRQEIKDINKRLDTLAEALKKLTDDDPENDESALEKVETVLMKAPGMMKGVRELLNTAK